MKKSTYNHILYSLVNEIEVTFKQKDYENTIELINVVSGVMFNNSHPLHDAKLYDKLGIMLINIYDEAKNNKNYKLICKTIKILINMKYIENIIDDENDV